ncbi:MAG: hypothetical protein JST55_05295 [Bacteroidetes bacterium]|nr:hypothetical protein [Bacteroidota bacterium]
MKSRNVVSSFVIGLILLYLMIPFLTTVFFIRIKLWPILLAVDLIVMVVVIVSYVVYCFVEKRKYFRIGVLGGILGTVLFFGLSYGYQLDAADYVFFKLREKKFNDFMQEINRYEKITQMSEGNNKGGSLNDKPFMYHAKDISEYDKDVIHLYSDLIKELNIDEDTHEDFIKKLSAVDCIDLETFKDGSVCFTINGWLNHCSGITYSPNGEEHTNYGGAKVWKHLQGNWYAWGN